MGIQDKIQEKVNDEILHNNLKGFATSYKASKINAYKGLDFEALRTRVHDIKDRDLSKVMEQFNLFKANVEKVGCKVFQANTGEDACKYIADVMKKHNTKYMVKSKSMTSEEILLNHYLEKEGLHPIETDLGEWILQLANEHPSHMVMPAIHKTRQQVAKIFADYTGEEVDPEDITGMVLIARRFLREAYFKAGVGMTGANFAVAKTGSIGLVTNEGNARLSSTVPPVHIVLVGYEKLCDDFNQALDIVRVLPKSATGQIITSYTTWIKGRVPSHKNEDGVKETHYVFLDNGRLAFLEHPKFKEALKCIRCGSCANICPAYEMVGGHVYGDRYIGSIGLILTALYQGDAAAKDILKMCIGCRACSFNCPAGIDLQSLISELKLVVGKKYGINPIKEKVFKNVVAKPEKMKSLLSLGASFQFPLTKTNKSNGEKIISKVPLLPKEMDFRKFPALSSKTFTKLFHKDGYDKFTSKRKVFFYPGCAIEYFYPEMGLAMVKLLNKSGIQVDIPKSAACCGIPAIASGNPDNARTMIFNTLDRLNDVEQYESLLVLCPTCGGAIKHEFLDFTSNDPDRYKKAVLLGDMVTPFGKFLEDNKIHFKVKGNKTVTYHTPCHDERSLNYSAEAFLSSVLGKQFTHLTDTNVCCGFGGTYSLDFSTISNGILDKKIENIVASKAEILVTDCPGCVMQINGGLMHKKVPVKVLHLSEFIDKYVEQI
ncbi:L-lactate dehydrogenase (quinone) large subunit LdhH [Ancylomarina sp. 16SWW S1-10-2]|uniref:L-lactate dehydrogenase (quinone) large subunit LdhH n=1 Tax=Ancylomarina sp. 16SWW S1-10-2 TaxID=2499681 RepID=UPI0012ADC9A4|nr:LUD domain-containing protein [Ancylomarina sp. 16SWW S1-10-2]MRT92591.1 FeS-binding protein [Ancylomarina sp. 16SWW S1-10-2]